MAEKKITKRERFMELLAVVEKSDIANKAEVIAFLEHEIELLDRKSSKSAESKNQKELLEIMDKIYKALKEVGKPVTITELMRASVEMAEYSNQKLSAVLKKMTEVENPVVVKAIEKKKSYFSAI